MDRQSSIISCHDGKGDGSPLQDAVGAINGAVAGARVISDTVFAPERLLRRYTPRIRRQLRAVLGSEQEHDDLVQEVLLVVITKVNTVRDPTCLDWWVARVTTNTVKQLVRRQRVRRHTSLEEVGEGLLPAFSPDLPARELASRVLEVILSLPLKDRELLTTYWLSPTTAETIAADVGCSVVTLRRKLARAQARFERLARRDPALARCLDDARRSTRRWRSSPSGFFPAATSAPTPALRAPRKLVA